MTEFVRREVALRRIEYVIKPPDPDKGDADYERYEVERALAASLIGQEADPVHDLRVIEGDEETLVTYLRKRVVLSEGIVIHDMAAPGS